MAMSYGCVCDWAIYLPLVVKSKRSPLMETYHVSYGGKVTPDAADLDQDDIFQKLKLPTAVIEKMKAGKQLILKKNLTQKQAIQYKTYLEKIGLACDIRLSLSPEILKQGLRRTALSEAVPPEEIRVIDKQLIAPSLFCWPKKYSIEDAAGKEVCSLELKSFYVNPLVILGVALLCAFSTGVYLTRLLSQVSSSTFATIIGILYMFSVTLILLRLLQPNFILLIRKGPRKIVLIERETSWIGNKKYDLFDADEEHMGFIDCRKKKAVFFNSQHQILLEWDSRLRVSDSIKDSMGQLQEKIIEDTLLDEMLDYVENIKKVIYFFLPRRRVSKVRWKLKNASGVFDQDDRLSVAYFSEPYPAYQMVAYDPPLSLYALLVCISMAPVI